MKNIARLAAGFTLAASASLFAVPTAQATPISYSGNECSASKANCFALFYNSGVNTWTSSCFLSNQSINDLYGYSPNGATLVRFVFRPHEVTINSNLGVSRCVGDGDAQAVKNNAAAGTSGEASATNTVYFNSGYTGPSQSFAPRSTANLNATLKNENASIKRTS
ncbi:hypothetical protein [Streptomyces clavuligerus]|uniref:Peptidase inhibitor family I36 n=1 Tax=Streptomyces clavuligerus TaxID=1901 RepID=B5GZT5_STRCL|nr:hypothetical protein [Streptomyces clavuligerus]ANW19214.1 hypothetical protein BB341_13795 [Streptomyces clavuligerus]AXU13813.1 hypothetical protein D1794_14375 [Streptomyces clavuligerus]EDY51831.1 hypothetical protein SSCG_04902 [Streptomyces clavuligerus]EFG08027.1 Hypothetical protein SCLAV_2956 [Streptomyces clavuligerus]MBY6303780.1 hypothetical protein [Streptomyces clavuligerus]